MTSHEKYKQDPFRVLHWRAQTYSHTKEKNWYKLTASLMLTWDQLYFSKCDLLEHNFKMIKMVLRLENTRLFLFTPKLFQPFGLYILCVMK